MLQVIREVNVSNINGPPYITHTVDKQHQTTEIIPRVKATNIMQLDIKANAWLYPFTVLTFTVPKYPTVIL
jgi:hypothetical protein